MAFETVVLELDGPVARLTLNRPRVLNAYNIQMRDELYQALGLLEQNAEIRAAVVRGAGERAFCAGADLTEFGSAPSQFIARQVRFERDVWARLFGLRTPLVAAVRGFCFGSGLEIALGCDLILAAPDAKFGLPETNLGMIPAAGGTQTMPRAVGTARGLDALLTGRTIEAEEAAAIGLVNTVEPAASLFDRAETAARSLAALDAEAVRAAKTALAQAADTGLAEGLASEARLASRVAFGR